MLQAFDKYRVRWALVGACAGSVCASACDLIVGFDTVTYSAVDSGEADGEAGFPGNPSPWDGALLGDDASGANDADASDAGTAGATDAVCQPSVDGGTVGAGNSLVQVGIFMGRGAVRVFRNGQFVGAASSAVNFMFDMGDMFAFEAVPCPGFSFNEFCGDIPNCKLSTKDSAFSGTITAAEGIVYALFQP